MKAPTVVTVGGWATTEVCWSAVEEALGPGVSLTHIPWARCLADRRALVEAACRTGGSVVVVGWSLGAMAALAGAVESAEFRGAEIGRASCRESG
mgnify:CR=1 FL=1